MTAERTPEKNSGFDGEDPGRVEPVDKITVLPSPDPERIRRWLGRRPRGGLLGAINERLPFGTRTPKKPR